jgi:hypothetical protein
MIYESKELLDVHDDFKTQAHDRKVEMHGNGVSPGLMPATLRLAGGLGNRYQSLPQDRHMPKSLVIFFVFHSRLVLPLGLIFLLRRVI